MWAPHSVHLLIAEYFEGEHQIILSEDWNLPLTFEKKLYDHPLVGICEPLGALCPTNITKKYVNGLLLCIIVEYSATLSNTIAFVDSKIHNNNILVPYNNNNNIFHTLNV